MKKMSRKQKKFQIKKALDGMRYRVKRNRYSLRSARIRQDIKGKNIRRFVLKFSAPIDFRLFENTDETIAFFNHVLDQLRINMVTRTEMDLIKVHFNLREVEKVSSDSIMYLIALMNSLKNISTKNILYKGNYPKDKKVRKIFEDSGFNKYCLQGSMKAITSDDDSDKIIQIKYGSGTYNPNIFKSVFGLISNNIDTAKKNSRDLSAVIGEIIGNVVEHAYSSKKYLFKEKEYYFFAEQSEEYIEFIALDTGVGIPFTMKKKFHETFSEDFLRINSDSKLLESGLKGEFRSQTNELNRSNGLGRVYKSVAYGNIYSMDIISNNAFCSIKDNGEIYSINNKNKLNGTLFRWRILKGDIL